MPQTPGTLLNNRYRIVSILGQGGMGAVYRAADEHLHIPVAVKENLFLTEEYGRQFQREAHILAGLRHPNLPHVTDYFSTENQVQYLVMDFIEGEDLRQRMERLGALPERETMLIGISICDALTYLHDRPLPIVHRDIKPGNIKVTADGQAVLVDFGLAKIMQGSQVTSTGARAMTPGYSPPEQYGTARTDPRSDIYSLGATLYATLTGVIPEDGLNRMTGKADLTHIRGLVPKTNRKLAEAIERALEIDPDDRYQNAEEFKEALIEAGELLTYFVERPSIPPPPSIVPDSERNGLLEGEELEDQGEVFKKPRSLSQRSLRRRQKRKAIRTAVSGLVILAVIGYLMFLVRPDLTKSVLAYFTGPTATTQATEVSSMQASSTSPILAQATETRAITSTPSEPLQARTPTSPAETTPTMTPGTSGLLPPAPTPQGGGYGQIAFASDKIGIMQVWLLDVANPKKQRQITDRQDGACQPTWSPDGMRLAFISPCKGKQDTYPGSNIFIMNVDAVGNPDRSSVMQITSNLEGDFDPAWSPDGTRIAYTSLVNGKTSIMVINLNDHTTQELSNSRDPDKHPSWSPSGMRLAYVRQVFYNSQVWTMTDNGQLQVQFTQPAPVNNLWPTWSNDEQIIFYSQLPVSPNSTIPILVYKSFEDRDKRAENRIIPAGQQGSAAPVAQVRMSPDGFWLAYESWPDGINHDIYIMNVNGSNQKQLTTDPGHDFGPTWRPVQAIAQP